MSLEGSLLSLGDLSPERIANALYTVSGGNKHLLTSEKAVFTADGIWGKAVKLLYPKCTNQFADRMLIYNFWRGRRKFVEVYFNKPQHKLFTH